ncbi:hypothetical protein A0H81_13239 [Grifola frondosa]|uniref:Uncharacterized protein n=1 Tax=Grifola frondosa TaxID=5627 RepID=A0A1C7LQ20_GRIFR|nr:hypothetical protein A0H81_13239 [Grifola frondosa]
MYAEARWNIVHPPALTNNGQYTLDMNDTNNKGERAFAICPVESAGGWALIICSATQIRYRTDRPEKSFEERRSVSESSPYLNKHVVTLPSSIHPFPTYELIWTMPYSHISLAAAEISSLQCGTLTRCTHSPLDHFLGCPAHPSFKFLVASSKQVCTRTSTSRSSDGGIWSLSNIGR